MESMVTSEKISFMDTGTNAPNQAEKAISLILRYIKDNNLQPGDRLPAEREMAERFSVSRQSLREAIKVLSMMNFLEVHKQGGTFVSSPSATTRFDKLNFFLKSGQLTLSEIFEARMIMEQECIALASQRITDNQLKTIKNALSGVDIDDAEAFAAADRVIHSTIYAAAGNRAMELLMQTVKMWTVVSQGFTNSYREVRELVQKDHVLIYEALCSHDAARCREAMRKHILHLDRIHYVSDTLIREELAKILDQT